MKITMYLGKVVRWKERLWKGREDRIRHSLYPFYFSHIFLVYNLFCYCYNFLECFLCYFVKSFSWCTTLSYAFCFNNIIECFLLFRSQLNLYRCYFVYINLQIRHVFKVSKSSDIHLHICKQYLSSEKSNSMSLIVLM